MRISILSDLHLEFGPVDLPASDADVVVLAGDIHPKMGGLKWIKKAFPSQHVIYVLGNHEYYGKSIPYLTDKLRKESHGTNVRVLENEATVIDGVSFLGCTLWTDFGLFGFPAVTSAIAGDEMNDYRRIRLSTAQFRKLRPKDTLRFHAISRGWLRRSLVDPSSLGKIVIISHHAPSKMSLVLGMEDDVLSAAYASNLDDLVDQSRAKLWVHGHMHASSDYMIGQTRIVCNPRGYPESPNPNFNPQLVIEV
jgi:predicted phosphohydrolase